MKKHYKLLNDIHNVYKPTKFEPRYFADATDMKLKGNKAKRKSIGALNYRKRRKNMVKELEERIAHLEGLPLTIPGDVFTNAEFEPVFQFTKEDEEEINSMAPTVFKAQQFFESISQAEYFDVNREHDYMSLDNVGDIMNMSELTELVDKQY